MKTQLFYAFVILMPVFYLPMLATAQVTVTGPISNYHEVGDTVVVHLKQNNKVLIMK